MSQKTTRLRQATLDGGLDPSFGKQLVHVRKRLELNSIASRVLKEHCGLFPRFALKAHMGFNHKINVGRLEMGRCQTPFSHVHHQAEMAAWNIVTINRVHSDLPNFMGCKMRDKLMTIKIKVNPSVAAPAFWTPKKISVKGPRLPADARRSITFDRGFEFTSWRELHKGMGTKSWFCDPQAPWQKGSVENMNKRVRRYLPRDTALLSLPNRYMKSICDRLNATPRKCLGYRTPAEAFRDELMKLGRR